MQAAVNKVAEGVDFVLKVLLGSGVHILQFFNWEACSAHFCRIEVADFCFELRGDVSFLGCEIEILRACSHVDEHRLAELFD